MTTIEEAAPDGVRGAGGAGGSATAEAERAAWVAFNRVPGIGVVKFRRLLGRFGELTRAWDAPRRELLLAGIDTRAVDAIERVRAETQPARELERVRRAGAAALIWRDAQYPALLAAIDDPPPVLYVRGTLTAADAQAVAMVGTRRATVYGRDVAERLAAGLATNGFTVVSGLAKGVDTHAHRGALAAGGRTIAVLGHGIDLVYPAENRRLASQIVERGALISDYAVGIGPLADNFPPRNRIISGLSAGVVVVEAGEGSGALITSNYAAEQGRDVFAVPGPITSLASRGCHRLIQQGAKLVESAEDIMQDLNPHMATLQARQLTLDLGDAHPAGQGAPFNIDAGAGGGHLEDDLISRLVAAGQPVHVDRLARESGRPVHEITATLTLLELQGRVQHTGGMSYQVKA